VSQDESREVLGGQLPKAERDLPEALNEELPDVAPVPGDGHRRKAAFLLEVGLIPLSQRCQRRVIHRGCGRDDGALLAQVLQEVPVPGSRVPA